MNFEGYRVCSDEAITSVFLLHALNFNFGGTGEKIRGGNVGVVVIRGMKILGPFNGSRR